MKQVRGTKNAVELIGWMGADPDLRLIGQEGKVCRFNVATRYISGQDDNGNLTYETQWTTVEAWDRLADRCNTYLHKGSRVLISGALRSDSWTDKESGQPRSKTYVRADDVIFLDSRPEQAAEVSEADVVATDEVPF
jgi:single-strand DNA-binding protein